MHRDVISEVLGCNIYDQYASSEGAPFILECEHGTKHIHPLTGVFEVVDEAGKPSREGELLITSFTTHGTPLVRYRIGDRLKLCSPDYQCPCGSTFQCVESIDGRSNDFVFSRENGRVNLGNISNSTKDVLGIVCFQIVQVEVSSLLVSVVGTPAFTASEEDKFVSALRLRVGDEMEIKCSRVDSISRENSGKFRIVKNLLSADQLHG
jgi:phenylacetate-CoA ligase